MEASPTPAMLRSMLRAFANPSPAPSAQEIVLDPAESRHLVKVRRARVGEAVEVLDGQGNRWQTRFSEATQASAAHLSVDSHHFDPKPRPELHLAIGWLKGKAMDTVLVQAVELGVASITPLLSDHAAVQRQTARPRWDSLLVEALKQSGNPWLPEIREPQGVEAYLEGLGAASPASPRLAALLTPEAKPIKEVLRSPDKATSTEAHLLIGPEGDFSPSEVDLITQAGFEAISLGPYVLRAETAAMAFLSAVRQLLA